MKQDILGPNAKGKIILLAALILGGAVELFTAPLDGSYSMAPDASATAEEKAAAYREARSLVINAAEKYENTPYRYGGLDESGMDCSGLIYTSFHDALKVSLPRSSSSLYLWVEKIDNAQLQPGDILFFKTDNTGKISHSAIFVGDGRFIHSASEGPETGVIYSSLNEQYWSSRYVGAGRALPAVDFLDLNINRASRPALASAVPDTASSDTNAAKTKTEAAKTNTANAVTTAAPKKADSADKAKTEAVKTDTAIAAAAATPKKVDPIEVKTTEAGTAGSEKSGNVVTVARADNVASGETIETMAASKTESDAVSVANASESGTTAHPGKKAVPDWISPPPSVTHQDRVLLGFALAPSWNGYMESGSVLRGFASQLRLGYATRLFNIPMLIGAELRPEWDEALGVFRVPLTVSWGLDDRFRVFLGPALSIGDATLKTGGTERRYSGGTSILGAIGITAAPFIFKVAGGELAPYGELAWQSYMSETPGVNLGADLAAGLRFSTGIRYTWKVK
jgi:probable lipoprotein NlpC